MKADHNVNWEQKTFAIDEDESNWIGSTENEVDNSTCEDPCEHAKLHANVNNEFSKLKNWMPAFSYCAAAEDNSRGFRQSTGTGKWKFPSVTNIELARKSQKFQSAKKISFSTINKIGLN